MEYNYWIMQFTPTPDETAALSNSTHNERETLYRAIMLYDALDNPDEVLNDQGVVDD